MFRKISIIIELFGVIIFFSETYFVLNFNFDFSRTNFCAEFCRNSICGLLSIVYLGLDM